jgi:hypothetical protein
MTRYFLARTLSSLVPEAGVPNTVRAGCSLSAVYSIIARDYIGYTGSLGHGDIIVGNIAGSCFYLLYLAVGTDMQKVENIKGTGYSILNDIVLLVV